MKLLTYIFTFAYILTTTSSFAGVSNESSIAAIVNDKSILTADLNHRLNLVLNNGKANVNPEMLKKLRSQVLDQMIDEILQLQVAEKYEINLDGPDYDAAKTRMEARLGIGQGELESYAKQHNVPFRVIKNQIRAGLGWQIFISGRYGDRTNVTDAEVKAELEKLEEQKKKNQVLLSEIVLTAKGNEGDVKQLADEVYGRVKSGESFPAVAQQYSKAPSAARGGDIGWVNVDDLEPEVRKVVQSSRRGDITMPIAVSGGYRILGVRDRHGVGSLSEPVTYVSFQQIEFKFPMFGGQQAAQEAYLNAQNIRNNARSCSAMKKLTDGRPRVKLQAVDRYPAENMHPQMAKLINSLKPGERSELMNTGDGLIMFMVCDRQVVKPHEPDAEEIKARIREKKLNAFYEKELRELRRSAMIEKRI